MKYLDDIIGLYQQIKSKSYDFEGIVFVTENGKETEEMFDFFDELGISTCTNMGAHAYRVNMEYNVMFHGSIELYQSKGYSFGKNIFYWHDIFVDKKCVDEWEDTDYKTEILF